MERRPGPSHAWYWVAGAVMLAGIVGAVVGVVRGVMTYADEVEDFQRVPAPGQGVVTLEAGDHWLYWEPAFGPVQPVPLADVQVEGPARTRIDVSVRRITYDVSGRRGVAVAEFEAPVDGQYVIRSQGTSFADGAIAVGDNPDLDLFIGIGVAILAVLVAGAVAGTIVAVVAIRRHHAYWRDARAGITASAPPAPTSPPAPPPAPTAGSPTPPPRPPPPPQA